MPRRFRGARQLGRGRRLFADRLVYLACVVEAAVVGGLLLTILSELTLCLATAFSVSLLALQASRYSYDYLLTPHLPMADTTLTYGRHHTYLWPTPRCRRSSACRPKETRWARCAPSCATCGGRPTG